MLLKGKRGEKKKKKRKTTTRDSLSDFLFFCFRIVAPLQSDTNMYQPCMEVPCIWFQMTNHNNHAGEGAEMYMEGMVTDMSCVMEG